MGLLSRLTSFVPLLLALSAIGCSAPEPVREAADLFGKVATSYKVQLDRFAKVSNAHRASSAERMARIRTRTDDLQGRANQKRTEWGIGDNKTAIRVFKELRALGDELEMDPSSGRKREASRIKSLQQKFGKATASTKELDKVLKAVAELLKDASAEDVIAAISPFVESIAGTFRENGEKVDNAFKSAGKLVDAAAPELEPAAEN